MFSRPSFLPLLFLLFVASVVLTSSSLQAREAVSINPPLSLIVGHSAVAHDVPVAPRLLTNAQRLARGLPLNKPYRRPTGTITARNSRPSATWVSGNILVTGTDGHDYGYISPTWNAFGEYGQFQAGTAGALTVTFPYTPGTSPTKLDISVSNSPLSAYPFFGASVGYSSSSADLGDNANYNFLVGTTQTAPDSPPSKTQGNYVYGVTGLSEDFESAIWSYNHTSGLITPQWVNTDKSCVEAHVVYVPSENCLIITGDVKALQSKYGSGNLEVTLKIVPF